MVIGYDYIFSTPHSKTSEICQLQFLFFAINFYSQKGKHRPCKTRVSESLNRQFLTIH